MGNYQSDKKAMRFFGLKLSKNTDKEIIEQLEKQESVQAYIKKLIREDIRKECQKPSSDNGLIGGINEDIIQNKLVKVK